MHNLKHGRIVVKKIINCTFSTAIYSIIWIYSRESWFFFSILKFSESWKRQRKSSAPARYARKVVRNSVWQMLLLYLGLFFCSSSKWGYFVTSRRDEEGEGDDPCYPTNHHFMSAQKNPKSWDTEETDSYIDNFGANLMGYIYSRYSRTALKPPAPEVILHRRQWTKRIIR